MLNLVSIVPFNILSEVINAAYFTFISFVLISLSLEKLKSNDVLKSKFE